MFNIESINHLLATPVIDGATALNVEFLSNDYAAGKKVLCEIEYSLKNCNEFYISVAFITKGGITPLLEIFRELASRNIKGYILTTDYNNFTDPEALKMLSQFNNLAIKIYVTDNNINKNGEGFHTKGYIFKNDEEKFNIIIGSSNLTLYALTKNKEWNAKITSENNEKMVHDVFQEFKVLWTSNNCLDFSNYIDIYTEKFNLIKKLRETAINAPIMSLKTYELKPNQMQVEFISNLKKLVNDKKDKALFISATGTGKTYASAFAIRELSPKKALFIVHREQIANKAKESYDDVFNQTKKLSLLSGNHKNVDSADIIFATIQTLSKKDIYQQFKTDEFETIVVDEAHRCGAPSYQEVLSYFKPKLLLGMTATPERSDDYDVYKAFGNNIVYEIRLQEALENNFLCPFHYFGITDFFVNEEDDSKLSDFRYLASQKRVNYILDKIKFYNHCGDKVRGLVFCSSKDEARELSKQFNETSCYKTVCLSGEDSQEERENAVKLLESDDQNNYLDYIFTVDIFNEGIDIPKVNQIIMLRPTQSPIVFVQQLGRGLRKHNNKEYVVILDFIGNYANNFMIPMALSGDRSYKRENLRRFVHEGNKILPGASTIHFDEIAKKRIFESIDSTNFTEIKLIKENYKELKQKVGHIPSLMDFVLHGQMDVQCIFSNKSLGAYYTFLKKYEPLYNVKLSKLEEEFIKFVSQKFGNGKRNLELYTLKLLIEGTESNLFSNTEKKLGYSLTSSQKINLKNILSNNFITGSAANSYKEVVFIEEDGNDIKISKNFRKLLSNRDFKNILDELLDYSLYKYEFEYAKDRLDNDFCLNKMYSYEDVCRLLNWEKNIVPLNIGGYKYDKTTNTLPIFINYHKSDAISSTIRYEDKFLDKYTLSWITKSKRTMTSPEVEKIVNEKINGLAIDIFVRKESSASHSESKNKAKSSDAFKEFYYLGRAHYNEGSAKEIKMTDEKNHSEVPAVQVKLSLEHSVRDDIFDYIVNK